MAELDESEHGQILHFGKKISITERPKLDHGAVAVLAVLRNPMLSIMRAV